MGFVNIGVQLHSFVLSMSMTHQEIAHSLIEFIWFMEMHAMTGVSQFVVPVEYQRKIHVEKLAEI